MKISFFVLFLAIVNVPLFSSPVEEIEIFIQSLPIQERKELERFFYMLMDQDGSDIHPCINYALWGDKPIATHAYWLADDTGAVDGIGESVSFFRKGYDLWERLAIAPNNKEYFFLIFIEDQFRDLVCINRKAFLDVVEKNIALFRYVLGPNLTPESLLQQLVDSKDYFYDVIKNDRVLFGILLGYGTQNAIKGTWKEIYKFGHVKERKEDFPLISKQKRLKYEEELAELSNQWTTSSKLKTFDTFRLPIFGCNPNLEETKQLLATYENNRAKIKAITEDKDFLNKTLLRLFTTTSGTLDIPKFTPQTTSKNPPEMDVKKLASLVKEELKNEPFFDESFLTTYLNGMRAAEGGRAPQDNLTYAKIVEFYDLKQDLEKAKNLKTANAYFSKKGKWTEVVPQKVYYYSLQKSSGEQVSRKSKDLTFHYSFETLDGKTKDVGTIKSEDLSNLIPGIALGVQGMTKGETREIHIHPAYGYGENNFFPQNAAIIAKIELIDFSDSTSEAKLQEPYQLVEKDELPLLEKYHALKKGELFDRAGEFWNFVKKKNSKVDLRTFEEAFSKELPLLSKEERMNFIEQHINA